MMGTNLSKVRLSRGDKVFTVINYTICALIAIIIAYPLYFVIIASVSNPQLIQTGQVWLWPKGFSLQAYQEVFKSSKIWTGYYNTIIYTTGATFFSLLFT